MYDQDPIDFILAQVKDNIKYLQSKGRVSESAAKQINELLVAGPSQTPVSARSPAASTPTFSRAPAPAFSTPVAPPPQPAQQTPTSQPQQVRALYDYNAPGDLNFRVGDVIELIPSPNDNDDWWTGRLNGQEGLFPSNHVEKIESQPAYQPPSGPSHRLPPPPSFGAGPGSWNNEKPPMPSYNSAPPYSGGYQPPPMQQAPETVVVVQGDPNDPNAPKKKNKFGKLGSTMGNAAAGGVGFGAGAAIGSGIINAIF